MKGWRLGGSFLHPLRTATSGGGAPLPPAGEAHDRPDTKVDRSLDVKRTPTGQTAKTSRAEKTTKQQVRNGYPLSAVRCPRRATRFAPPPDPLPSPIGDGTFPLAGGLSAAKPLPPAGEVLDRPDHRVGLFPRCERTPIRPDGETFQSREDQQVKSIKQQTAVRGPLSEKSHPLAPAGEAHELPGQ